MRVLVTGSSGLIGSETVSYYDGLGHEVHGVRVVAQQGFGAGTGPGGSSEMLTLGSSELRWRGESEDRKGHTKGHWRRVGHRN